LVSQFYTYATRHDVNFAIGPMGTRALPALFYLQCNYSASSQWWT